MRTRPMWCCRRTCKCDFPILFKLKCAKPSLCRGWNWTAKPWSKRKRWENRKKQRTYKIKVMTTTYLLMLACSYQCSMKQKLNRLKKITSVNLDPGLSLDLHVWNTEFLLWHFLSAGSRGMFTVWCHHLDDLRDLCVSNVQELHNPAHCQTWIAFLELKSTKRLKRNLPCKSSCVWAPNYGYKRTS